MKINKVQKKKEREHVIKIKRYTQKIFNNTCKFNGTDGKMKTAIGAIKTSVMNFPNFGAHLKSNKIG